MALDLTPPQTATVTTHGLAIIANGIVVGGITDFSIRQRMDATAVFELGAGQTVGTNDVPALAGEPYEIVPGNIGGTTVTVRRYEIYRKRMKDAFGTDDLTMLTNQKKPIIVREFTKAPDESLSFANNLYGFYFTDLGVDLPAAGDRIRKINATGMFTRIREVDATPPPGL